MGMHIRLALAMMLLFAMAGLLTATDDSKQQAAVKKALDELQGTWKPISIQSRGKQVPDKELKDARLTFEGDKLLAGFAGQPKGKQTEQDDQVLGGYHGQEVSHPTL